MIGLEGIEIDFVCLFYNGEIEVRIGGGFR